MERSWVLPHGPHPLLLLFCWEDARGVQRSGLEGALETLRFKLPI